jgi:electron transfer flavoprotein alpha subunit
MSWIDLDTTAPTASEWHDVALWKPTPRLQQIGESLAQRLGCYCKIVEGDLAAWVESNKPEILLSGEESPLPSLAQKWRTGLVCCFDVDLDLASRLLVMKTHAYGGRMIVEVVCPDARPQIAILTQA